MDMLKDVIVEDKKVRVILDDTLFRILQEKKVLKQQELYYSIRWDSSEKLTFNHLQKDALAVPLILNLAP